eukprot:TRINITY_DN14049_c0_g1_i1.p1 TRINITY_DN14049_c0_g1~~TRINITY_DN14049_c0_g1_i1.p1  ORF type:complete len:209 (-),score=43.36 TRINITY_DN14049_c0_g1_i1:479-1105(-)
MTNYNKWDKFAADLASDTEEEEEQDLARFTGKNTRYIHIPPKEFTRKPQLCQLLEEEPEYAPPSSQSAGVLVGEDVGEVEPGVAEASKKFKWSSIGSQFIPGYGANSEGDDLWRVWFDDNFLSTQKVANPAARALLGNPCLGSFVVACLDRKTGKDRPISRKEVADLIMRRQQGLDGERIAREREAHEEGMKVFDQIGAERVNLNADP